MSAAPIVNDPPVQQSKISKPKNVRNKSNDRRQQNDWDLSEFNRVCLITEEKKPHFLKIESLQKVIFLFKFRQGALCLFMLMMGNLIFILYLNLISGVQLDAWEDVFRNLTNSTIRPLYQPISRSNCRCAFITLAIIAIIGGRLLGISIIKEIFRRIKWKLYICGICLCTIIGLIIFHLCVPIDKLHTSMTTLFTNLVFSKDTNGNLIIKLPEPGCLPPQMYYPYYCVLCVTILCNIQHILLAISFFKSKPKNFSKQLFDFFFSPPKP